MAVKKAKCTLMDNVSPSVSLDNDGPLRALVQICNTPDPDCNISLAETIFRLPIQDAFSFIRQKEKFNNSSIQSINLVGNLGTHRGCYESLDTTLT